GFVIFFTFHKYITHVVVRFMFLLFGNGCFTCLFEPGKCFTITIFIIINISQIVFGCGVFSIFGDCFAVIGFGFNKIVSRKFFISLINQIIRLNQSLLFLFIFLGVKKNAIEQ